jgi:ankyrin repeat protein
MRSVAFLLVSSLGVMQVYAAESLIDAAKNQNGVLAAELIAEGNEVNARQSDGATALHWAAYRDDLEIVNLLIKAGADAGAVNDFGVMPLSLACTNGSAGVITALLDAGADVNGVLATGDTPLMTASRTGIADAVSVLLERGADVNASEPQNEQTALMWALSEGHTDVARVLVAQGADIHAETKGSYTPLMFASRANDLEGVKLLLEKGADVNHAGRDGHTSLHISTMKAHIDLALQLLDAEADPNAVGPGYTALHWAVGKWETEMTGRNGIVTRPEHEWSAMHGIPERKLELVEALLDHGADANARMERNPRRYGFTFASARPKGSTPFALAALAGEVDIMRMLMDFGADPLQKADRGMTPLIMAAGSRRNLAEDIIPLERSLEAVKICVEAGADVNATDERYGETALHGAARIKSVAMVQYLYDNGADVNVVNKRGQSPLYFAERYWPPGIAMIFQPSDAGDLLRDLTLSETVKNSFDDWARMSPEVRAEIEALLKGEKERLRAEKDRREEDPIYPPEGGFPES